MHEHTHAHSRRDFFQRAFGGILAGASVLEEAFLRASWARMIDSRDEVLALFR